jgi:hypothetical protein
MQVRNFRDLLKRELNLGNRVRMSAVCKSSKNALCDKNTVARHVADLHKTLRDVTHNIAVSQGKEQAVDQLLDKYFEEGMGPQQAQRIWQRIKSKVRTSYVFLTAFVLLAFAIDSPQYAKYLKNLGSLSEEDFAILAKGFTDAGLSFAIPSRAHRQINEVMRAILENQFGEDLEFMMKQAHQYVFKPYKDYKASREAVVKQWVTVGKKIDALGVPSISKMFKELTPGVTNVDTALPNNILKYLHNISGNLYDRFPPKYATPLKKPVKLAQMPLGR